MTATTDSTADVLDGLSLQARTAISEHRDAYEHHHAAARAAHDPETAGREQAVVDAAMTAWNRALGSAAAIEQVADALGVDLANDRRRHLPRGHAMTDATRYQEGAVVAHDAN